MADSFKVAAGAAVVKLAERAGERMLLRGTVFPGADFDEKDIQRLAGSGLVVKVDPPTTVDGGEVEGAPEDPEAPTAEAEQAGSEADSKGAPAKARRSRSSK